MSHFQTYCASPDGASNTILYLIERRVLFPRVSAEKTLEQTWSFIITSDFDKAIVQRQIVSNGILPALFILPIVLKQTTQRFDQSLDFLENLRDNGP